MLFASLILSATFASSMFALTKASKVEGESSSSSVKQPDIHIHNNNNSHGGYSTSYGSTSNGYGGNSKSNSYGGCSNSDSVSDSTSQGGDSDSDSVSDSCSNNDNKTTDNISEDIIRQEIDRLRAEFMKKQELDMRTLQELDRVSELLNKRK